MLTFWRNSIIYRMSKIKKAEIIQQEDGARWLITQTVVWTLNMKSVHSFLLLSWTLCCLVPRLPHPALHCLSNCHLGDTNLTWETPISPGRHQSHLGDILISVWHHYHFGLQTLNQSVQSAPRLYFGVGNYGPFDLPVYLHISRKPAHLHSYLELLTYSLKNTV